MSARQILTPDLAAPVPVAARVVEAQELAPLSAGMGPEKENELPGANNILPFCFVRPPDVPLCIPKEM
jgi:hypothetical protein